MIEEEYTLVESQILEDIANQIILRGGSDKKLLPEEMPYAIQRISGEPTIAEEDEPIQEEWINPEEWLDLKSILQNNQKPEYQYSYAMLVRGDIGNPTINYINVPGKRQDCQWYKTSWGLDEACPNSGQKWILSDKNKYEWIIVYSNTDTISTWGPIYSTYDYRWLVWWYGPNMNIKCDHGFHGILSLQRVDALDVEGFGKFFGFGTIADKTRINVRKWKIKQSSSWVNGIAIPNSLKYLNTEVDVSEAIDLHDFATGAEQLQKIDVKNWNTVNVKSTLNAFASCFKLKSFDAQNWDTSNLTSINSMFSGDLCLENANFSNWTCENIIDAQNFMKNCFHLIHIDCPNFEFKKCTKTYGMFQNCCNLKSLNCSKWNFEKLEDAQYMFDTCTNLNISGTDNLNLNNLSNSTSMFIRCRSINSIDFGNTKFDNLKFMSTMFSDCANLSSINSTNWSLKNVLNMDSCFANNYKLEQLDTSNWEFGNLSSMSQTFRECRRLKSIETANWNLEKCKTIYYTFYNCKNLSSIDFSNFNMPELTSMQYAFSYCTNANWIKANNLSISKLKDTIQAFSQCQSARLIETKNWNTTSELTSFASMFQGCLQASTIDITGLNTKYAKSIDNMFNGCKSLEYIIGTLDCSSLTSTNGIFTYCYSLKKIPEIINCSKSISFANSSYIEDRDSIAKFDSNGNIVGGIVFNLLKPSSVQTISFHANVKTLFTSSEWSTIKTYLSTKSWNISPA